MGVDCQWSLLRSQNTFKPGAWIVIGLCSALGILLGGECGFRVVFALHPNRISALWTVHELSVPHT